MKNLLVVLSAVIFLLPAYASHLKGGFIHCEQTQSSTVIVTVHLYSDGATAGGGLLDFGDGSAAVLVPELATNKVQEGIHIAVFSIIHAFVAYGSYTISYTETYRPPAVNLTNSTDAPFYIDSKINIDPFLGKYVSPQPLKHPVFFVAAGDRYSSSLNAVSETDNQLIYKTSTPQSPNSGFDYHRPENFNVDPFSGLASWDTRFNGLHQRGDFLFQVRIYQLHQGMIVGHMTVEFIVTVVDSPERLKLTTDVFPDDRAAIYLPSGASQKFKVFFESNASDDRTLELVSELDETIVTMETHDSLSTRITVGNITIRDLKGLQRANPYLITVRGKIHGSGYSKDITFLILTEEVDLTDVPIVLQLGGGQENLYQVYPNPFDNALQITHPVTCNVRFLITDLSGKILYDRETSSNSTVFLNSLPAGMYLYHIVDKYDRASGKLLKRE